MKQHSSSHLAVMFPIRRQGLVPQPESIVLVATCYMCPYGIQQKGT